MARKGNSVRQIVRSPLTEWALGREGTGALGNLEPRGGPLLLSGADRDLEQWMPLGRMKVTNRVSGFALE